MKNLRLFLTIFGGLGMTIGLILVLFLFSLNLPGSPALAGGAVRYVATTGSDAGNDCTDSGNPCKTIPHTIDVALAGDTIEVGAGEFTGTLLINKDLQLMGAGQALTSINGEGIASVIQVEIDITSVISGVKIFNGHAYSGGGIMNNGSLHVINTNITKNIVDSQGGGIHNNGTLTLTNALIYTNTAYLGGISNYGVLWMTDSTVKKNFSSTEAGGIYNFGTMTISSSIIAQNTANSGGGGGIKNSKSLIIFNSSIISNTNHPGTFANKAGGILNTGELLIQNSEISGNFRGGIHQGNIYPPFTANASLINVSIINNFTSFPYPATGLSVSTGSISIQNSIIAFNEGGNCSGSILTLGNNLSTDDLCNLTATGDMENVDPKINAFIFQNTSWFHTLLPDSPAIDTGSDSACPETDIRNKLRPADGNGDGISHCDIGAYELIPSPVMINATTPSQINTFVDLEARVTAITLTTPITYKWFMTDQAPITNASGYVDQVSREWSTAGTKTITVQATGSNGLQVTGTKTIEIVHKLFLPLLLTPFAPEAGIWDMEDGYFYVTADRKNIQEFSVFFYIPNCGDVRIYTTELVPIINNSFSFNDFDSYYATGTFDSIATSSGIYGLDSVYIDPCEVYWTVPITNWTGTPMPTITEKLYAPYEPDISQSENLPYKVELLSNAK